MFTDEIQAGGYYVGGNRGEHETFIRHVLWLSEGKLAWRDFGFPDGKSIGMGQCSAHAFSIWAIRLATEEEIGRCHQHPEQSRRSACKVTCGRLRNRPPWSR